MNSEEFYRWCNNPSNVPEGMEEEPEGFYDDVGVWHLVREDNQTRTEREGSEGVESLTHHF